MPDLAPFHRLIVFAHILGVFLFLLAHGVSVGALLRLRGERDPAAVRTLVDLSARSFPAMTIGALVWFISGILAGFSGNYWTTGKLWIWASLVVAVLIAGVMTPMGRFYLDRVRTALGMDPKGKVGQPLGDAIDPQVLDQAIASGRPLTLAAIGLGGVAILSWLMVFKPF